MNLAQRFQRFIFSRKNIGASLLALGGAALFVLGITGGWVGLGLIAALYGVGYLLIPAEQGFKFTLFDERDAQQITQGLSDLVYSLRFRVSDDVMAAVEDVARSIKLTLPTEGAPAMSAIDPNVMLIRQTALNYLPQALDAYLALPRMYAERIPVQDGHTARDVLIAQLQLISQKMRETSEDMYHYDADRLLSNARFLQERFAQSSFKMPVVDLVAEEQAEKERVR
jgi:hypothetical protein